MIEKKALTRYLMLRLTNPQLFSGYFSVGELASIIEGEQILHMCEGAVITDYQKMVGKDLDAVILPFDICRARLVCLLDKNGRVLWDWNKKE